MRIKLVKSLKGGEILAEPVLTEEREILIQKGTSLKPEYLDLISFLGIEAVCIEDPFLKYESPHKIISTEKQVEFISRVQKILENHIYSGKEDLKKIEPLARDIIEELKNIDEHTVIDMEERNGNLYEHTIMVTLLALIAAKKMKVKEEEFFGIAIGCLLHDLGLRYITVPYSNYDIENSTSAELFEYRKHTILAFSALEGEEWIEPKVKKMILAHHERKDGSGFPLKQKIKEIDCNILQAVDAFDCFISGIECKRIDVQSALEYLVETSDILYEKKVVKIIEKIVARYPVGTIVNLNTGEVGIVVEQTGDSTHPIISVLDEDDNVTDLQYNLSKNKKITILQIVK